jgi:hypothetical protein
MHTRLELAGRAVHPVLGTSAMALLGLGTALDVLGAGHEGALTWLAFWVIAAGVAAGTCSATFALLDWMFVAELGEVGVWGLAGFPTATLVAFYGLATLMRVATPAHAPPPSAVALEVAAAALLGLKTWMGRELGAWLDERR